MRNPRKHQKPLIGIGIAALVAVLGLAALASDSARIEKPAAVDAGQYAEFTGNEVFDLQDLAEGAEIQRRWFNRITPPGFSWVQPMFPSVAPFDAVNFDEQFLNDLLGEDKNSVSIYPLSLSLDPKTRETLVYNADGKLIAAIPADRIFRDWPEDADPARVVLQLDLLPSEDVEPYLYVEGRIAQTAKARVAKPERSEGMVLRSLGAGEFGFAGAHRLTNGQMRLTATNGTDVAEIYSYTVWHTSTVVVTVWTNEYDEVVTSTNLVWDPISPPYAGIESAWACQTTNLVLSGGVGTWDDADVSTNARVRFYAAAKRIDSDGDGLTDGAEIFLHRTDPGLADTDGDGWSDEEELAEGTDPLDRFSATRLARGVVINEVLYNDGTAEQRGEWIELYSTGLYPVNLDGFQIEVGDGNFNPVYALSNVWLHAGQALLLGGSEVAGRDQGPDAGFGMPNRGYSGPTAAVRLVATNDELRVVDCLMYGGNVYDFNSDGLDTTGWISETAYYAEAGSSLYRRFPGHDTDQAGDWYYTNAPTPHNTNDVLDADDDGLSDEQEWTGSLNDGTPTNPYNPDSDGDGLDDRVECVEHHTNPNAWATDGDIFPWPPASGGVTNWPGSDSYEIAYGWNPHIADQNTNGMLDSWEMAFPGTNLYADADGDGVTNLFEILQNSNPLDSNSFVALPYTLQFESSMAGWSNDGLKDVGFKGWVKVNILGIATNVDVCLWIVEGSNSEPFTLTWSGVANGAVTMVDDQHAIASASLVSGTHPSLLVQDNGTHPNYTNTLGGEYKIDVLKVEITRVISDQLPERECNVLPDEGLLYMGSRSDDKGYLQIEAQVLPQQTNNIGLIGIRHGSNILDSASVQQPKTALSFDPAGSRQQYEIVGGCDLNGDGELQNDEVCVVFPNRVFLLNESDYNYSLNILNNYAAGTLGVGSQLLEAYVNDTVPPYVANSTTNLDSTDPSLTNPIGATWSMDCNAQTRFYTYIEGTEASDEVEQDLRTFFALEASFGQHKIEVQDFFVQHPLEPEHMFGPWSWQSVATNVFDSFSLHFAFGHVAITGTVTVTVRKSDLSMTHMVYSGSFEDIYDFDYNGEYPSQHGATCQAGFPTLGMSGRVFRDRVEFIHDTIWYYDFN